MSTKKKLNKKGKIKFKEFTKEESEISDFNNLFNIKKNFSEDLGFNIAFLNKKRAINNFDYFTGSEEEENDKNYKIKKDHSDGSEKNEEDEDSLPEELIDLINERKGKEPFTKKDFEKYVKFYNLKFDFIK